MKHCESARSCSSHQSPFSLNFAATFELHMLQSLSGTPCSAHQSRPLKLWSEPSSSSPSWSWPSSSCASSARSSDGAWATPPPPFPAGLLHPAASSAAAANPIRNVVEIDLHRIGTLLLRDDCGIT